MSQTSRGTAQKGSASAKSSATGGVKMKEFWEKFRAAMRAQVQRLNPMGMATSAGGGAIAKWIEAQEDSKQAEVPSTIGFVQPVDPHWLQAFFLTAAAHPDVFGKVHTIVLSGCALGDAEGARTVKALAKLPSLKMLEMTSCMIGPETCAALAHALVAGAQASGASGSAGSVTSGGSTGTGAAGATSKSGSTILASLLSPSFAASKLQTLKLDGNEDIGDLGAQHLAVGIQRASALSYLSLAYCNIGPLGCTALARAIAILYDKLPTGPRSVTGMGSSVPNTTTSACVSSGSTSSSADMTSQTLHSAESKNIDIDEKHEAGLISVASSQATTSIINEATTNALSAMGPNANTTSSLAAQGLSASGIRGLMATAQPFSIILEGNPLRAPGTAAIAFAGMCGVPFKSLNLARTQFSNGTMDTDDRKPLSALIGCILACPTLESLDIDGVPIGNAGVQSLLDNLVECKHILDIKVTNSVSPTLMTALTELLSANILTASRARKAKLKRKPKTSGSSAGSSLASLTRR